MKSELRRQYAAARANFVGAARDEADKKILNLFTRNFMGYDSYFVYNGFKSEAATGGIIAALLAAGKRVYLPRVSGGKMLRVPYGETHTGAYGIQEPDGEPYLGNIDVTVTPLLAVDGHGYRLGYGGGYYDKFFAGNDTLRLGIGYGFQQTETRFNDGRDKPLDVFICERGITFYDKR